MLLALTLNRPFSPLTCKSALRSRLVSWRVKPLALISLVWVVERWLKSPATFNNKALSASSTPPTLLALPDTFALNISLLRVPLFFRLSTSILAICLPERVPWFSNSLPFTYNFSPEINVPVPFKSPFFTTAYTRGTNASTTLPLGSVTFCFSIHTISEVSWATCSGVKLTPTVRLNFFAKVSPASIKDLYCSSKVWLFPLKWCPVRRFICSRTRRCS